VRIYAQGYLGDGKAKSLSPEFRQDGLFEQLSDTINRLLPRELTDEARDNLKGGISSVLDQFDLVTREELEVQEAVLRRTREKLEALEAQVAELGQRLSEPPRE